MRIAILFSGELRTFAETIGNNIMYFKQYSNNIDIYYAFTDNVGYFPVEADTANAFKNDRYVMGERKITNARSFWGTNQIDIILEPYLSKTIYKKTGLIKKQPYEVPVPPDCTIPYKICHQFYLLQRGWDNSEGPRQSFNAYDLVVRLRPDVVLQNPISGVDLEAAIRGNMLIVNKYTEYDTEDEKAVHPGFFMGPPHIMRMACSVYNNFRYIQELIDKDFISTTAAQVFYGNLYIHNLNENLHKYDFNYKIIR